MPINYCIKSDKGYILEQWSGHVSITDLEEYWTLYLSDAEVMRLRKTIVDLRNATIAFKGQELDDLVQSLVVPKLNGLRWKSALVVSDPVQYGISRQYHVFSHLYSKDSVFYDIKDAERWINGP
jgi:hypothetical protein